MKSLFAAAAALLAPFAFAQTAPSAAGHWEGPIVAAPGQELRVEVDLSQDEKHAWSGTISVPAQSLHGFPLSRIAVEGNTVRFAMEGPPGDPSFEGKLAVDGQSITGDWTQGGKAMPLKLTRTGDAQMPHSTPISKEFEGTWEGTLDANGTLLRLIVKLVNQPGGATGSIISVDQGNAEIPIATITQKGTTIQLDLPKIAGTYLGEINKEGTRITGQWSQGANKFPLTLNRPAK
jgi:uncharacterized protein